MTPPVSDPERRLRSQILGLVYPLELLLVFVLSSAFACGISPYAVFRTIALTVAGFLIIGLLLRLLLRDMHRAGIALLLVFLALASWPLGLQGGIVVIPAVVIAVLLDRLPRRRITWGQFSEAGSKFGAILLTLVLIQAGMSGQLGTAFADLSQGGGLAADNGPLVSPEQPDIYVIVIDGHARSDIMASQFGLDESGFLADLETRGFDVSADSHSNYPETALTFASMLNMAYLDQIPAIANVKSGDPASTGQYREVISRNAVFKLAHEKGYQTLATGSGFDQVSIRSGDVYLDGGQMNIFEATLARMTVVGDLIDTFAPSFAGDQMRGWVDSQLNEIAAIARTPWPRPRLVFGHVTAPHPPLVFGRDGEPLPLQFGVAYRFPFVGSADDPAEIARYRDQAAYVDSRTIQVVDSILANARRPAVIVLLSDHGSRMDHAGATSHSPEATCNFFAALTPGHPELFGQSPTPINLYPQLFNTYLGLNLTIRPDLRFNSTWEAPLDLHELPADTKP
jgi:hypothetical protein